MRDRIREWWEKRFFRIVAYMAFGLFFFMIFMVVTFPQHRVKQIASVQIEKALDNRYEVTISDMGFWRFTGVQMRGIQIKEREITGADGRPVDENAPMIVPITVSRISARLAPIRSLLNRGPTINYQVEVGPGSVIRGQVVQSGPNVDIGVRLNRLDLREATLLTNYIGMPLFGVLDGKVDLRIDTRTGAIAAGNIDLTGQQLTLPETTVTWSWIPVFTQLDLPTTSFGNLRARIRIEQQEGGQGVSRLTFDEFMTQGRDINTQAWGHVDMNPRRGNQFGLEMRMAVNDEYVTANDLGFLFNYPMIREGRDGEWYGFVFSGSPGSDNFFRGSTTAARGPQEGEAVAEPEVDDDGEE